MLQRLTLLFLASAMTTAAAQTLERVRPNDNRARAGVFASGVLAIRMEARLAEWRPQGEDGPGLMVPVFAEIGRPPAIPGPLIRVNGGTEIIAVVRNAVPNTILTIHGLHSRPALGAAFNDSIQLAYGQIQTLRFRLDRPGTYYYWGKTTPVNFRERTREDAQLTGAIVVDEPGERAAKDRIFVIGMLADSAGSETNRHRQRELFVINGRSWPHTDRLVYSRGEQVRWRVINASADPHPMHLHGFYYRVTRTGDGRVDTTLARPEVANTHLLAPGSTMSMSWTAERLGNWLFHCHTPAHIAPRGPLGMPLASEHVLAQAGSTHGTNPGADMGGLVTAVEIRHAEEDTTAKLPPAPLPEPARRLRMLLRPNAGTTPSVPYYGIAFQEPAAVAVPDVGVGQQVGPTLVLNRGEHTSIQVVNLLSEATSVHWHGIELESFYDGVPGFSGVRPTLAPAIAPADSFEVRMTPPRAGTFIYHSHLNETRQQRAGVTGALIVVEKGKWDPTRDIPLLISSPSDSAAEERSVLINGNAIPTVLEMRRGVAYRLRLINITTARMGAHVELVQDSTLQSWREVAKDGADLPPAARGARPARAALTIGETKDVELQLLRPGDYALHVRTASGTLLATQPVRVQ